ncbi:hypothetical protein [Catelliglobosispora koreensis]|uniref:hypothetical protein n=1 Tax=Catelliglobosispora koreensis TaxID=129052 RepID=UPI00035CB402|nr:hypothetical protein [Catelliglobosispora koreensis]
MRRLLTPRWLLGHAFVWLAVAVCLVLGWWQAGRAAEGNTLSWGYMFQWPLFAIFLIILWVKEIRNTLRRDDNPLPVEKPQKRGPIITRQEAVPGDDDDPQLAAYNRYLAEIKER